MCLWRSRLPKVRKPHGVWWKPLSRHRKSPSKSAIWNDSIRAVLALENAITQPLFFEIHRMSEFSPRSLDVDVVLDLMIHDIDIVLSLVKLAPDEIRAAGVSILSPKVDIANVRLQFPGGRAWRILTASRVSTERIRKLRLFQPHEYISLDYSKKDAVRYRVSEGMKIDFAPLVFNRDEPLKLEIDSFADCIVNRTEPRVTGAQGLAALETACAILEKIEEHHEHARFVAASWSRSRLNALHT